MTENPFTDGQQFSAARLNSMYNAHQREGVVNGCDVTTSANNFDVQISSGKIIVNNTAVDVTATTVSHSTSDPEDRIDLITADNNGAVSITQGTPAATSGQPIAPDMPNNQVLLSLVFVRSNSTEILTGDINDDYRAEIVPGVPSGIIVMFGGAISNIPDGWKLCDGTDGTPDLRDRFIAGAGDEYSVNDTGGEESVQLTENELPSHTHEYTESNADNTNQEPFGSTDIRVNDGVFQANTSSAGSDQAHENRPPYYALAYIQKQ
jgi:microcystin-dependent protein